MEGISQAASISQTESISQAERERKDKNRIAAKNHRAKKEKMTQELRRMNDELKKENEKLVEEKKALERQALEYRNEIQNHSSKGCKIPSEFQDIWEQELATTSAHEYSLDEDACPELGIFESNHTLPFSPEYASLEKIAEPVPNTAPAPSAALTLFSGVPLQDHDVARRRSNSSSSKSSHSPPAPPAQPPSRSLDKPKDLKHFLASDILPKALAPISTTAIKHREMIGGRTDILTNQALPTALSEPNRVLQNATVYIPDSSDVQFIDAVDGKICINIQNNQIFEINAVSYEDEMIKTNSEMNNLQNQKSANQNSTAFGFSDVDGFFYPEDLQQVTPPGELIPNTKNLYPHRNQVQESQKNIATSSRHSPSQSSDEFTLPVHTIAPALLDICPEMSLSLQEQIKTSYSNSYSSVSDVVTLPSLTQNSQGVNKENKVTHQGLHQQVTLSAQKDITSANGQQTMTNQSTGPMNRNSFHNLMTATVMSSSHAVQTARLQNNQSQTLQRQMSGQNLQNTPFLSRVNQGQQAQHASFTRQTNQMASLQQEPQFSPRLTSVPTINTVTSHAVIPCKGTSTTVQSLDNTSSAPVMSYSHSDGSTDSNGNSTFMQTAPQDAIITGHYSGNEIFSTTAATTQSLTLGLDPCLLIPMNADFSHNLQDLPSLNLADLNTDNNLFEKKPSRAAL